VEERILKLVPCLAVASLAAPAFAIFPDNPDTTNLFPFVGKLGNTNAVAIDPYWALTAAHVGGMTLNIGGVDHTAVESFTHPTTDLRLLRFANPLPHYTRIYYGPLPTGTQIALAGHGQTANYTATGWNYIAGSEGVRRWGTNTVDQLANISYSGYNVDAVIYRVLAPGQAGLGPLDSGGGMFVMHNGGWHLAATSAFIFTGPTGQLNEWGAGGGGVYLTSYQGWIQSTVPEPGTMLALAGGGIALILRRRRKA
jgi:hypothetical protein